MEDLKELAKKSDEEIVELVNETLIDEFEFEKDKMAPEANLFEDLGLDSLDGVDLVVALEQSFKFKIKEEEVRDIRTLDDIYRFVLRKRKELLEGQS